MCNSSCSEPSNKNIKIVLGLRLFRRDSRSLLLTEERESYYLDIRDIVTVLKEATSRLQTRNTKETLTVSVPPSFAIQRLVPQLSSFNQENPGIDLRIQSVGHYEAKLADEAYGRGNWLVLHSELLYSEYLLAMYSPSLIIETSQLISPISLLIGHYYMIPLVTISLIILTN